MASWRERTAGDAYATDADGGAPGQNAHRSATDRARPSNVGETTGRANWFRNQLLPVDSRVEQLLILELVRPPRLMAEAADGPA